MKILIKESQYVYILENLDKNKKFLNNLMGIDFTGKIEQVTSTYDVPMEFDRNIPSAMINRYLNKFGPMYLFELNGKKYLYLDVGDHEKFIDEKGNIFIENEIPEKLGIDVIGLRFSNIIDMYFNEEEPLNENIDKNKKFLTNLMGIDFTGKIKQVTSSYDVPTEFDDIIGPDGIRRYLNFWGPMYLFDLDGKKYLYQDRDEFEWFLGEDGYDYVDNEITDKLNIDVMGLRFSDIIDMYFNEGED